MKSDPIHVRGAMGAIATIMLAAGCLPLDVLGENETVAQHNEAATDPLADDDIATKHPAFDPGLMITETFGGCGVTLNKSGSVTKLDVVPLDGTDSALGGAIFASYAAAMTAAGSERVMPTMEIVDAWLKPFTDGVYAAVELAVEDGSNGAPMDKRTLLNDLVKELLVHATTGTPAEQPLAHEAAVTVAAALALGGGTAPPELAGDVNARLGSFAADPISSTPIGFYTWTPQLSRIFQQDRILQGSADAPLSFGAVAATAVALDGAPPLAARYGAVLDLYAGLTNPPYDLSARALGAAVPSAAALSDLDGTRSAVAAAHPEVMGQASCAAQFAILPASDSPETKLFRNLYCKGLPPGTSFLDVLVDAIRSGRLDLTPSATSGFYDRQIFALETLLAPDKAAEKDHLFLTKRYKEKLVDTFKTLVIERRETHAKQLGIGGSETVSAQLGPVDVFPLLPVEPFPTFYLRTARAYQFLDAFLRSVLGNAFFDTTARVIETGERGPTALGAELKARTALLYGLHLVSAASIGLRSQMTPDEEAVIEPKGAEAAAREWLAGWSRDADVARDPRVAIPIDVDLDNQKVIYLGVVGTKVRKGRAGFYPGFEPKAVTGCAVRNFVEHDVMLLGGQSVQFARPLSSPPLSRDAFRAICDQHSTQDDIVKALESP